MTSEMEAPWLERAAGARLLVVLSAVLFVAALLVTGRLAGLLAVVLTAMLPLILLLGVIFVVAGVLPGGRSLVAALVGSVVGAGLRGGARGIGAGMRGSRRSVPGRQLTVQSSSGRDEEVVVASSRRFPAGARIRSYGPLVLGRRHAWFVRPAHGGLIVARGVPSALVVAPALSLLAVGMFVGAVR